MQAIASGELRSFKKGGRRFIFPEDLNRTCSRRDRRPPHPNNRQQRDSQRLVVRVRGRAADRSPTAQP